MVVYDNRYFAVATTDNDDDDNNTIIHMVITLTMNTMLTTIPLTIMMTETMTKMMMMMMILTYPNSEDDYDFYNNTPNVIFDMYGNQFTIGDKNEIGPYDDKPMTLQAAQR